ncbi:MAG: dTMP kinase [Sutterella sp.]|nr:dTMP kinase [Sutterella sp.]
MVRGRFITFEGIDGAGKTTQIDALERLIRSKGIEVVRTREPGGTPAGEKIRAMLLSDDMTVRTETLLFFAARAEHVETLIRPALERGAWVLSDRFTDATYAYQTGGKGMDGRDVEALEAWTLGGFAPDRTVLFDISPETAARRRAVRAGEGDRFERESTAFFTRVRNAYLDRAARDPKRFLTVDASDTPEHIEARIREEFLTWL